MARQESKFILLALIILIVCAARIGSDIYSPSIPIMSKALFTSVDMVQFSMSVYMFGISISQLAYGPISEALGRKKPIIFGLFVMSLGTLVNVFATNIELIIVGRMIEGVGAGACSGLWRAIARDTYKGEELAKSMSYLIICFIFIIPAAPLFGGYLSDQFGWRSNFVFMLIYGILALFCSSIWLKETNKHKDIKKLRGKYIIDSFIFIFRSRRFMQISASILLTYGAFFAWFLIGPVLLVGKIGISSTEFGLFNFFGIGGGLLLSSTLNGKLVSRFGTSFMIRLGWGIAILAGLTMLTLFIIFGVDFYAIIIPTIIFAFGLTFIFPNAFAESFAPFDERAGYAAAVYGSMQLGGGALFGFLASYLPEENQLYLALMILGSSSLAWFLYENSLSYKDKQ